MEAFIETDELAGSTRAAIRGFINYLIKLETQKLTTPNPLTPKPNNLNVKKLLTCINRR